MGVCPPFANHRRRDARPSVHAEARTAAARAAGWAAATATAVVVTVCVWVGVRACVCVCVCVCVAIRPFIACPSSARRFEVRMPCSQGFESLLMWVRMRGDGRERHSPASRFDVRGVASVMCVCVCVLPSAPSSPARRPPAGLKFELRARAGSNLCARGFESRGDGRARHSPASRFEA